MTTNLQLEEYCKEVNIKLNGIYNKDNLPYLAKRKDGFYIVNSQDEYNLEGEMNGGIHWVCFVVEGKECCYMIWTVLVGNHIDKSKNFPHQKWCITKNRYKIYRVVVVGNFVCGLGTVV